MTLYILDTNIVSDLIRNPQGAAAVRLAAVNEGSVCTSIIVAAELRYGLAKRPSARLAAQLDRILSALDAAPFAAPAEHAYAELRARLEAAGTPISGNDMLIAAHALSLRRTLVTANVREFARVDGLRLENWLEAQPEPRP